MPPSAGPDPERPQVCTTPDRRSLAVARAHCRKLQISGRLLIAAPDGTRLHPGLRRQDAAHLVPTRRRAIDEAFRWGEPALLWQDDDRLLLAVALSVNQHLCGGLIIESIRVPEPPDPQALHHLTQASWSLQRALEQANFINASLMADRRKRGQDQREQAEALHASKLRDSTAFREGFARLQPELLLAIRRGDRPEARRLLNALLMYLYNIGRGEFIRVRELIAELVGQMRQAVLSCGVTSDAHPVLATPLWERLSRMADEEELSPWLHRTLEDLISALDSSAVHPARLRVRLILDFLSENLARPLTRELVASKAGLSPSEFSRMLRRETGRTFGSHLRAIRVDQACRLLRCSPLTIQQIGAECGYNDQAHFTRIFKSVTGKSPGQFRSTHAHNSSKQSHKPSKTEPGQGVSSLCL